MFNRIYKIIQDNIFLTLIVVLGIILRVSLTEFNPPALNWDEVSHGFNAYSILKTGRDEWGSLLPVIFRAYGDYKLPLYIYLTSLSEAVLGLNAFAVRFVSILSGIFTIFFSYFLVLEIFTSSRLILTSNKKNIALLTAFLVSIEPWTLFLSRGAFEANLSSFLIVSGVYFFLRAIRKVNSYSLFMSLLLLGLSVWTYNSARGFVPIFLVSISLIYKEELISCWKKNKKKFFIVTIPFVLLFLTMFVQLGSDFGQARFGRVTILDQGALSSIEGQRAVSVYPPLVTRLLYNKLTYMIPLVFNNWISHYSPSFLFLRGGSNYQFSIPGSGLLYLVNLPFILIGLLYIFRNWREKAFLLVLAWIFLGPVASSVTRESPHVLRAVTMLPLPMIVSSIGFFTVLDYLGSRRKKWDSWMVFGYIFLLLVSLGDYLHSYFGTYRTNYAWVWQYGYKEAVELVRSNYVLYDKIVVTKKYGEPHEFFLFYWPWDPAKYSSDSNLIRFHQSDWFWVDRLDKIYFVNDWEIPKNKSTFILESKKEEVDCSKQSTKCLLVTSPGNYPNGWKMIDKIKYPDDTAVFEIYENK